MLADKGNRQESGHYFSKPGYLFLAVQKAAIDMRHIHNRNKNSLHFTFWRDKSVREIQAKSMDKLEYKLRKT